MKVFCFVLLIAFCYVECRKAHVPIDKNANVAFINMEGGGVRLAPTIKPAVTVPSPAKPAVTSGATQVLTTPVTSKPVPPITVKPASVSASQTQKTPTRITPQPMYPSAPNPVTTPGPGSVKQLITFYDSQGKASPIRPYTYSQAVKQG